jgi:hypothetical protein
MIVRSAFDYLKVLTTTDLSTDELISIITECEKGMHGYDNWNVLISGNRKGIRKIGPKECFNYINNKTGGNGDGAT